MLELNGARERSSVDRSTYDIVTGEGRLSSIYVCYEPRNEFFWLARVVSLRDYTRTNVSKARGSCLANVSIHRHVNRTQQMLFPDLRLTYHQAVAEYGFMRVPAVPVRR